MVLSFSQAERTRKMLLKIEENKFWRWLMASHVVKNSHQGYPHHEKAKVVDKAKHGRSAKLRSSIWLIRYFVQTSLEENEAVIKKFEQAAVKSSYTSNCQIFHLNSYR